MNRAMLPALLAVCIWGMAGCEREARRFTERAGNTSSSESAPRASTNQPASPQGGGVRQPAKNDSPYDDNAYAVAQGKHLYRWYNCNGCHANGGGGMGPPLMDREWRYGSDPASIFETITRGRPGGMPSFGGHIPDDQVWQLVAYVRSIGGLLRKDVAPGRSDTLSSGPPEVARTPLRLEAQRRAGPQQAGGSR